MRRSRRICGWRCGTAWSGARRRKRPGSGGKEFGNVPLVKDVTRRTWGWEWLESAVQELKYALRRLLKSPGFTIAAVATLALGIGANTAIFELLDAVLLQSLPVENPQELAEVRVVDMDKARGSVSSRYPVVTNPIWEKLREDHQGFSEIAAWSDTGFSRDSGGDARFANGLWVSGNFFRVLGVRPIQGRVFTAEDDRRGCGLPGAVISYGFWQQEYGGGPALGRKLMLNDKPVEVIGITPANFFGVDVGQSFDVAVPVCSEPMLETRNRLDSSTHMVALGDRKARSFVAGRTSGCASWSGIARDFCGDAAAGLSSRKREGLSRDEADGRAFGGGCLDAARTIFRSAAVFAGNLRAGAADYMREPGQPDAGTNERSRAGDGGAAGDRRGEMAFDPSGVGGEPAAVAGGRGGRCIAGARVEPWTGGVSQYTDNSVSLDFKLDWRLFAFLLAVSLVTCVLFGLAPALRASRTAPVSAMKTGRPRHDGEPRAAGIPRSAGGVAGGAVAGAAVRRAAVHRSLRNLLTDDPGFQAKGVLIAGLDFTRLQIPVEKRGVFQRELLDRIRAIPGVDAAAETNIVPLGGNGWGNAVWIDGHDATQRQDSNFSSVSPEYFETLRIPMVAGRDFNEQRTTQSPRVAIVNEAFAKKLGLGDESYRHEVPAGGDSDESGGSERDCRCSEGHEIPEYPAPG